MRALCDRHGAVLVFDETVTGFRFARGGAQALFGVTPDLATFGKGLANGLPLSVVAGRADLMRGMEEIFFSTTFGGETLSLAAARAVLDKLVAEPVLETIAARGTALLEGTRAAVVAHGLADVVQVSGHPAWSFVQLRAAGPYDALTLKTLFLQECLARGVLTLGTHTVCYALGEDDVAAVLAAYGEVFAILREALDHGDLHARLRGEVLQPLFRVR